MQNHIPLKASHSSWRGQACKYWGQVWKDQVCMTQTYRQNSEVTVQMAAT